MINLFSGTPGSGKSYHTAMFIYNNIKNRNCVIIANFPVNLSGIKRKRGKFIYLDNSKITPQRLAKFAQHYIRYMAIVKKKKVKEGQILLILDEAQLLFNAREWRKADRSGWNCFFTQHRHYKYDVYLIAQFDRMLDSYIRSLLEYEFKHRKIDNYGMAGKILSLFVAGNFFVAIKRWYPMRENVGSEFFVGHNKYYKLYDTTTIFDV